MSYERLPHGSRRRMDGGGDMWANLHREMPKRFYMEDIDGHASINSEQFRLENTEQLTFIEYVPDHQIDSVIRHYGYIALFDRKLNHEAVKRSKRQLSLYLDICRALTDRNGGEIRCRFIYVIGGQVPPLTMINVDIYDAKFGEPICLTSNLHQWLNVWNATGLTGARDILEKQLRTHHY